MAATLAATMPTQRAHSAPVTTANPAQMSRMPTPSHSQPHDARSFSKSTVCTSSETSSSYLNAQNASKILKIPLTASSAAANASQLAPRRAVSVGHSRSVTVTSASSNSSGSRAANRVAPARSTVSLNGVGRPHPPTGRKLGPTRHLPLRVDHLRLVPLELFARQQAPAHEVGQFLQLLDGVDDPRLHPFLVGAEAAGR